MRTFRGLRGRAVLIASILLVAISFQGVAAAKGTPRPVKVMTRNLYLGADLNPALAAQSVPDLMAAAASIFSVVEATDFPSRAEALAREIKDADPTLIGLQEVAVWYSGPLGHPDPATTVEYDFLELLTDALEEVGHPYDVVGVQPEADIEAPAGAPYYRDFRLLQRDVILVKRAADNVSLTNLQSGNFTNNLVLPIVGGSVTVTRGWISVDAVVNKRHFRFINTHLEAFSWYHRMLQAQELVGGTGPVATAPGDVILVGDLNTGPELPMVENTYAWFVFMQATFVDTWAVAHPGDDGYTSGFSEYLDDPYDTLEHRVDHVITRGTVDVLRSRIYGTDSDNRTSGGLWPSDHAGVMATLAP